jgi:nucleoside-diphosphate-sugar epimerase
VVIGSGLLAKAFLNFRDNGSVIIFASGVSNSLLQQESEFEREFSLLKRTVSGKSPGQRLIYFSTFNVFDESLGQTAYVLHKKIVEKYLAEQDQCIVVRLPIILATSLNPNTLINFLLHKIKEQEIVQVYSKAWRYLVSLDDVVSILSGLLNSGLELQKEYNISYPFPIEVAQIADIIEDQLQIKCLRNEVKSGTHYSVENIFFNLDSVASEHQSAKDYFTFNFEKYYL